MTAYPQEPSTPRFAAAWINDPGSPTVEIAVAESYAAMDRGVQQGRDALAIYHDLTARYR